MLAFSSSNQPVYVVPSREHLMFRAEGSAASVEAWTLSEHLDGSDIEWSIWAGGGGGGGGREERESDRWRSRERGGRASC